MNPGLIRFLASKSRGKLENHDLAICLGESWKLEGWLPVTTEAIIVGYSAILDSILASQILGKKWKSANVRLASLY